LTRRGRAVWTRRGEVLAVHAPGNHPGVQAQWLEALALGYRVAVRPSRREPFTPHRLVTALRESGFSGDQVVLLPTEHDVADELVREADLAMVYGGDEVVDRHRGDPNVLPQGPGRSKILLTGEDWRDHLDMIVDSIVHQAGVACVNATAVFVDGDPAPVAEALAARLGRLAELPPEHGDAVLPVQPEETARAFERHLVACADGAVPWHAPDGIARPLGDGSSVLYPAVHQVARGDAPQTRIELPFPCVWVAPWSPEDGIAPLRDTLALTVVSEDEDLVDRLVAEPSISNVYVGDHPTHWTEPGSPHDGYLAEFLMRSKSVFRN
ncbi:aldehyde dehydrogenase family protein, partial [Nocardiopsis lucentensis]|uniref:aldehyde dehydrogenase family protein n=1 Tax=Nocardiopsis lucentensis TaxID=53441 RepID=UPI000360E960